MMTLQQAAQWLPGSRVVGDELTTVLRVHTDSRTLCAGDFFVALAGEKFDAHDFLPQAAAQGAVAALATHGLAAAGLPGLEVADTKVALGQLAAAWRAQFELPLIAVTGSNGKTTVTQMIASILQSWKSAQAFATEGNFNNDIGVPLTLLRLRASHSVGVVELGMNHPGEITYLAKLVQPSVALINNAQREHLEFMHTVDAVALENGSVLQWLSAQGTAVFPADDAFSAVWRELAGTHRVMTFAMSGDADVVGSGHWQQGHWRVSATSPAGPLDFPLHVAGRHNVKNALAAAACALAAGVPLTAIAQGLGSFSPVKGRSRALAVTWQGQPITLIDDTYNANPDSMQAAIDVLAELPSPRLLVMGDMGEVGDQGPQFHEEAGAMARLRGITTLFTLGEQAVHAQRAFSAQARPDRHFKDMDSLIAALQGAMPGVQSVLVKGSRFMKMERAVHAIEQSGSAAMTASTQQKQKDLSHAA
jgi:UDP-N-acetylmuramoyl-tripeptide--D-alanyl-D-alanine ligase